MERTFLEILPLAIGAAISPTGLLFVMMILSGKGNAKKSALDFVLGGTLFLVMLGLFIFFTAKPVVNSTDHPNVTSSIIDIVLGILILGVVIKSVFFKKKPKTDNSQKKKKPYPMMGFLYMLINVSTLIPFIAAVKIISMNKLAPWDGIAILLITILITMSMIAFPVAISYAMPHESQKILGPVNGFMAKNGSKISNVYFALMALYLFYHGVMGIMKVV